MSWSSLNKENSNNASTTRNDLEKPPTISIGKRHVSGAASRQEPVGLAGPASSSRLGGSGGADSPVRRESMSEHYTTKNLARDLDAQDRRAKQEARQQRRSIALHQGNATPPASPGGAGGVSTSVRSLKSDPSPIAKEKMPHRNSGAPPLIRTASQEKRRSTYLATGMKPGAYPDQFPMESNAAPPAMPDLDDDSNGKSNKHNNSNDSSSNSNNNNYDLMYHTADLENQHINSPNLVQAVLVEDGTIVDSKHDDEFVLTDSSPDNHMHQVVDGDKADKAVVVEAKAAGLSDFLAYKPLLCLIAGLVVFFVLAAVIAVVVVMVVINNNNASSSASSLSAVLVPTDAMTQVPDLTAAPTINSGGQALTQVPFLTHDASGQTDWMDLDLAWIALPSRIQQAAMDLGYNEQLWNSRQPPATKQLAWSALSASQQQAAIVLGYTEDSWNLNHEETAVAEAPEQAPTEAPTLATMETTATETTPPEQEIATEQPPTQPATQLPTSNPSQPKPATEQPTHRPAQALPVTEQPTQAQPETQQPTTEQTSGGVPALQDIPTDAPTTSAQVTESPVYSLSTTPTDNIMQVELTITYTIPSSTTSSPTAAGKTKLDHALLQFFTETLQDYFAGGGSDFRVVTARITKTPTYTEVATGQWEQQATVIWSFAPTMPTSNKILQAFNNADVGTFLMSDVRPAGPFFATTNRVDFSFQIMTSSPA